MLRLSPRERPVSSGEPGEGLKPVANLVHLGPSSAFGILRGTQDRLFSRREKARETPQRLRALGGLSSRRRRDAEPMRTAL